MHRLAQAGWAAAILVQEKGMHALQFHLGGLLGCQNTYKVLNRWNGSGRPCVLWFVCMPQNIPDARSDFTRTAKFGCRKAGSSRCPLERKGPDPVTGHLTVTPSSSGTSERRDSVIDKEVFTVS